MLKNTIINRLKCQIFADYNQVMICDSSIDLSKIEVVSDWWTEEDNKVMVSEKENNRLIIFETYRNTVVPVDIFIHSEQTKLELDSWDHAVECSINIVSDNVLVGEIFGEVDNLLTVPLIKGLWGITILFGGRNTISQDGLSGDDHYQIHFWLIKSLSPLKVLKL